MRLPTPTSTRSKGERATSNQPPKKLPAALDIRNPDDRRSARPPSISQNANPLKRGKTVDAETDIPSQQPVRALKWVPSAGDPVELRQDGTTVRTGFAESIMPDGTGFWIAAQGPDLRMYIPLDDSGLYVRPAKLGSNVFRDGLGVDLAV